jgi:phage head maturation protease
VSAPSWQLEPNTPSWYLEPREGRIKQTRGRIHRAVASSPTIERSAADGALVMDVRFAVFDTWQEINSPYEGRFLERIARGAFTKTLREGFDRIKAVVSHGRDANFGETILGKITEIREEDSGAVATVNLFPSVPSLLVDGLRAGVYGASFRGDSLNQHVEMRPGRSDHNPEGLPEVTRTEIRLKDIGPTAWGAYSETSAVIE